MALFIASAYWWTGTLVAEPGANPLTLSVVVQNRGAGDGVRAPAVITLRNDGASRLAVTETFGFETLYLRLEIERKADAQTIHYPRNSQYELFSVPQYRCLGPQEETTISLDLERWYHMFGGREDRRQEVPEAGPYGFTLPEGSYRIRAVYSSPDHSVGAACPVFEGPVSSPWSEFVVVGNEPGDLHETALRIQRGLGWKPLVVRVRSDDAGRLEYCEVESVDGQAELAGLVRAADRQALCSALGTAARPAGVEERIRFDAPRLE